MDGREDTRMEKARQIMTIKTAILPTGLDRIATAAFLKPFAAILAPLAAFYYLFTIREGAPEPPPAAAFLAAFLRFLSGELPGLSPFPSGFPDFGP